MSIPALTLEDVRKSFGNTEIVRGVTLRIPWGERWALIGPNGAGKSLLLNLISGFLQVSAGTIVLQGQKINGMQPCDINRHGLSRSFQVTSVFPRLTVTQNLQCAVLWSLGHRYCFWRRLGTQSEVHQRVDTMLERIGLTDRRFVAAGLLTYAEQRALELGITMVGAPEVILLDEPTAGMSRSEADKAIELIRSMTTDKTVLMVEHDMNVVFRLAERVAVMVQGEIIACDTPPNIRNNAVVQAAYLGSVMSVWK